MCQRDKLVLSPTLLTARESLLLAVDQDLGHAYPQLKWSFNSHGPVYPVEPKHSSNYWRLCSEKPAPSWSHLSPLEQASENSSNCFEIRFTNLAAYETDKDFNHIHPPGNPRIACQVTYPYRLLLIFGHDIRVNNPLITRATGQRHLAPTKYLRRPRLNSRTYDHEASPQSLHYPVPLKSSDQKFCISIQLPTHTCGFVSEILMSTNLL